jgi:hypothetical protein
MLDDVLLEEAVGHPKRLTRRVQVLLLQVIAVAAIQVADGAARLRKYLELAGRLGQRSILRLAKNYLVSRVHAR